VACRLPLDPPQVRAQAAEVQEKLALVEAKVAQMEALR
jgi:hypothetical protein